MPREIKFRGKSKEIGEWLHGSLIDNVFAYTNQGNKIPYIIDNNKLDEHYDCWEDLLQYMDEFEVIPETVGENTGLKDKNGKEIYEGDIIKLPLCNDEIVTLEGGCPNYRLKGSSGYYELGNCNAYCFEVIGNIYENPELLEG